MLHILGQEVRGSLGLDAGFMERGQQQLARLAAALGPLCHERVDQVVAGPDPVEFLVASVQIARLVGAGSRRLDQASVNGDYGEASQHGHRRGRGDKSVLPYGDLFPDHRLERPQGRVGDR